MNPLFFLATCLVGPLMGESRGPGVTCRWGDSNMFFPFTPPALLERARPCARCTSVSVSGNSGFDITKGLEMVGCAVWLRIRSRA